MSKELEALKDIREHSGEEIVKCVWENNAGYSKTITINDLCDIIETALEDYESLKILNENQNHNIELLMEENKMLKQRIEKLDKMHTNALNKIANDRKKLKALEIIKEKKVSVRGMFYHDNCENYNNDLLRGEEPLTEKEYNLLEEVLFNGR